MSVTSRLVFDPTEAASSNNVGAYLRASDGTLLTHTDVGGKKALDVRVAEGINVEVDLAAADDSVAAWLSDGAGNAISSTGGSLHIADGGGSITVDGSVTVSATDLDIRDLTQTDEITVFQGTDPWVVSATDLDIRDLTAGSDSVAAWLNDSSGNPIDSTGTSLNVHITGTTGGDAALANTAIDNETRAVSTTSIAATASVLSDRKYLFLANEGNKSLYWGKSTSLTAANGFPLHPGMQVEARIGAAVTVNVIGETGASSEDMRVMQIS